MKISRPPTTYPTTYHLPPTNCLSSVARCPLPIAYCLFPIAYFLFLTTSCNEKKMDADEIAQIGITTCQRQPQFLPATGLDPKRAAFSTSEKRMKGIVLLQFPANTADTAGRKTWQHPSWSVYGYMGPITTDENGNIYTAPIPVINELDNAQEKQNTIYKVGSKTGEMMPFVNLTMPANSNDENIFGLLGLYYDCHAQLLYAASVAGSTRDKEAGIIYAVDPQTGKIIDQLNGKDAIGLCVGGITGEKRLYFGSARTPDIYSIELTKAGKFTGSPRKEFSLDLLGPRGDDKARRIRFEKNGQLIVFGVEFNYNLTAPTERQETVYHFRYDEEEKKWLKVE